MISSKIDFIEKFMCLLCKQCSRKKRIEKRLYNELNSDYYDFEKDEIASKIILEEA